jgi:hypothetical protein
MEDESAFHLLSDCPSLISLRMRTFSKPILGVEEYEGASASALLRIALASGRFTVTPWLVHSYEHFSFLYCLILSVCLFVCFLVFQFFLCVVHIRPDLWPACGDFISPTFNPSIDQDGYRNFFSFLLQHLKQIVLISGISAFALTVQFRLRMFDGFQVCTLRRPLHNHNLFLWAPIRNMARYVFRFIVPPASHVSLRKKKPDMFHNVFVHEPVDFSLYSL